MSAQFNPVKWNDTELAALLDEIIDFIMQHVILETDEALAISLWILFAHLHKLARHSPVLTFQSVVERCGKTTALEVTCEMVPNALLVSHTTPAGVNRLLANSEVTLLLDEVDQYLLDSRDFIAVLNGGYTRCGANILRAVEKKVDGAKTFGTETLNVWGPKAIGSIGPLPRTVQDRSIVIPLHRKLPTHKVKQFGPESQSRAKELKARIERLAAEKEAEIEARLRAFDPAGLQIDDRAADNWALMLAIAEVAGPDVAARAKLAARSISHRTREGGQVSFELSLLEQIRAVFIDKNLRQIGAEELTQQLVDENGGPISSKRLAAVLRRFGISAKRTGKCNMYRQVDFADIFARYLDPLDLDPDQNGPDVPF